MLECLQAPAHGGETVVADMQPVYDPLDATTRDFVGGRDDFEHPLQPVAAETAERLPDPPIRPVAGPHSITGRKGLYSPVGSMIAIEGMQREPAHRLMRRL